MAWSADDYIILFFFVVGALLHGITGFGYPIVGTAVVAGFYPLKVAVAMVVVCGESAARARGRVRGRVGWFGGGEYVHAWSGWWA